MDEQFCCESQFIMDWNKVVEGWLISLFVGILTLLIGKSFQRNNQKAEKRRDERTLEREKDGKKLDLEVGRAERILLESIGSMEVLFSLLKRHAWYVATRKANVTELRVDKRDTDTWTKYEEAADSWNNREDRFHAQVCMYFGEGSGILLQEIHDAFEEACHLVESTYHFKKGSVVGKDEYYTERKQRYFFGTLMTSLQTNIICLLEQMTKDVQDFNVGSLRNVEQDQLEFSTKKKDAHDELRRALREMQQLYTVMNSDALRDAEANPFDNLTSEQKDNWNRYNELVEEWMATKIHIAALVGYYVGADARSKLKDIQGDLAKVDHCLQNTYTYKNQADLAKKLLTALNMKMEKFANSIGKELAATEDGRHTKFKRPVGSLAGSLITDKISFDDEEEEQLLNGGSDWPDALKRMETGNGGRSGQPAPVRESAQPSYGSNHTHTSYGSAQASYSSTQ